ncbi:hypothetical protein B0H13DRAFT_2286946 [Mycena leptocephala]|nr:hypothetical protein B0H13DRAFT_2286946 [Mycena leptocephala]
MCLERFEACFEDDIEILSIFEVLRLENLRGGVLAKILGENSILVLTTWIGWWHALVATMETRALGRPGEDSRKDERRNGARERRDSGGRGEIEDEPWPNICTRPLHPLAPATASTPLSTKKTSKAATPADGEKKKGKQTCIETYSYLVDVIFERIVSKASKIHHLPGNPDIRTVMSWPSTRFCLPPPPDHLRWRSPRAVEPKSDTIDIHTMTMKKLTPSLSSSRSLRHVPHQHYGVYAVAAAVTPPPLLAAASAMAMGRVPPAQRVPRWKVPQVCRGACGYGAGGSRGCRTWLYADRRRCTHVGWDVAADTARDVPAECAQVGHKRREHTFGAYV